MADTPEPLLVTVRLLDCADEALPGNFVDGEVEKKEEAVKA